MAPQMTEAQIQAFLREDKRTAKVATVRADGQPHVVPVGFVLEGDQIVFTTRRDSVKGRNLRRDPRVTILVDDETQFSFVQIQGWAQLSTDLEAMLRFATAIGARYFGPERAEEFGRRNSGPNELLVSVVAERVITLANAVG